MQINSTILSHGEASFEFETWAHGLPAALGVAMTVDWSDIDNPDTHCGAEDLDMVICVLDNTVSDLTQNCSALGSLLSRANDDTPIETARQVGSLLHALGELGGAIQFQLDNLRFCRKLLDVPHMPAPAPVPAPDIRHRAVKRTEVAHA